MDKNNFYNRELSWLMFNERVLLEAKDHDIPLFERLKFLSITAGNLDEFFMVRVASLKNMIDASYTGRDIAGMTANEQMEEVSKKLKEFKEAQYACYNRSLTPLLAEAGIKILSDHKMMSKEEREYADRYFNEFLYPVLTPMAVDSARPFPLVRSRSLNIGALVKGKTKDDEVEFAMVQVPGALPRLFPLPQEGGERRFILLEQIILANIDRLFLNYDVIGARPFRITRSADLTIDEDDAGDLMQEIEKQLKLRQRGDVVRLEVQKGADKRIVKYLGGALGLDDDDVYRIDGPLDLTFLMKVYELNGYERYKENSYAPPQAVPGIGPDTDLFEAVRERDILMHHPYETFSPVVRLIEQAASDEDVLAIKQTLYRVSGKSPIIEALAGAAENGKQVTVLVELKARFDEENNIVWARRLEQAGCHVIYGLKGLKTHCKITLIVRREEDGIRRYVHLATGNYNDSTARLYTDIGLMTCKETYGADATAVFNMLSGYSEPRVWNRLVLAPLWLKERLLYLIGREKERALSGEPARIIAKMNSLCHEEVIEALYDASAAGVRIDLIVRGICSLRTGIKGVSENIQVRSIVGNFLEHSRIFYFENGYNPEVYCSSADWMPRNLERRVEIMFPVEDAALKERLKDILMTELEDTEKAYILQADGTYSPVDRRGRKRVNSQMMFGKEAAARVKDEHAAAGRVFTPRRSHENT